MTEFNPERLMMARKQAGLSQSALAVELDVDSRSVRGYESGEYTPSDKSIEKLANILGVTVGYFFKISAIDAPEVEQVSFRALSKLSAAKRDMARYQGQLGFEFMQWLEEQFDFPEFKVPEIGSIDSPEAAANELRAHWKLGNKPISNMVHLLESKGIRVLSLDVTSDDVDAFCTWRDQVPFVFLNTRKSAARARFDAAHELAHIVLHRHGDCTGRSVEVEANQFASAFLMPKVDMIASAPKTPTVSKLLQAKKRWGVSAMALLYRMKVLGLVSDWQYQSLVRKLSQRGLRSNEISDEIRETSALLSSSLKLLNEDGFSIPRIAEHMDVDRAKIVSLVFGLTNVSIQGGKLSENGTGSAKKISNLRLVVDNA